MQLLRQIPVILAVSLMAAAVAAHPATERYIPIGQSPGISGSKSYMGRIESIAEASDGIWVYIENAVKRVKVTESTLIYLQHESPGKTSTIGDYTDCDTGQLVEINPDENGIARWMKIRIP